MSAAKWQQGPWHYYDRHGARWLACGTRMKPFVVCVLGGCTDADAALIAAAPDLAEALEALLMYACHSIACPVSDMHIDEPTCTCGVAEQVTAARAALAKARGER